MDEKIDEDEYKFIEKLGREMIDEFEKTCMEIMGFDKYDVINLSKDEFKQKLSLIGIVFGSLTMKNMDKITKRNFKSKE